MYILVRPEFEKILLFLDTAQTKPQKERDIDFVQTINMIPYTPNNTLNIGDTSLNRSFIFEMSHKTIYHHQFFIYWIQSAYIFVSCVFGQSNHGLPVCV